MPFYFVPPWLFHIAGMTVAYSDLLGLVWIATSIGLYIVTLIAEEPKARRGRTPPVPLCDDERQSDFRSDELPVCSLGSEMRPVTRLVSTAQCTKA